MTTIAAITMVQKRDRPHAFSALRSFAMLADPRVFRLVLLNDETDDDFAAELERVVDGEVIQAGGNLGVAGGRNRLIKEAIARNARFILSVDDDILLPPDFATLLHNDFNALAAANRRPGIITVATLDFHRLGGLFFNSTEMNDIENGRPVATPQTSHLRSLLNEAPRLKPRDIYHMGIRNWRGAYLFTGSEEDRALQALYGVQQVNKEGPGSDWRHTEEGVAAILNGGEPLPIDTAPGGICMYSTDLVSDIGFHDKDYNPFGYEDADFALRARAAGYENFCVPRAIAIHDIAARLSQRPISVLKATQGKMAGSFARKHLTDKTAAAAFFAISTRAAKSVTARSRTQREYAEGLATPERLKAFSSYVGNAIHYALPPLKNSTEAVSDNFLDQFRTFLLSIAPVKTELQTERTENAILIKANNGEFRAAANVSPATTADTQIDISIEGVTIPSELLPELLGAFTTGAHIKLAGSAKITAITADECFVEHMQISIDDAFVIEAAGRLKRGPDTDNQVAPLQLKMANLSFHDKGALARLIELFSIIERLSPAAFLERLSKSVHSDSLKLLLCGEIDRIDLKVSGTLDGQPGPLKMTIDASQPPCAQANASVRKLKQDDAIRNEPAVASRTPSQRPVKTADMIKQLRSLPQRLTSEDPSVAPFPDAYNPSSTTKLARKLRYVSAGRGIALAPNELRILAFKNRHAGERAFIIGNGPSLNKIDLTKLKNETTFGVNAIYLNKEKMGFLPTHHIVEDVFVAEDRAPEINALSGPTQWFGNYLRYCLTPKPNVCWLNVACDYRNYPGFPHFSTNAARIVWVGGTVSYIALQLAYFMGFKTVYLVGFDHSYSVPKEAKVEGRAITSTSDDPNHFHPDYFGKGYRWHDPRVDRMEQAYIRARHAFEVGGRKIINATAGGQLEVFERASFDQLF